MALAGTLFRFKAPTWPAPLQAFESPNSHSHDRFCVYVGGLTDGLLACSYVEALGSELDRRGWSMVQPVLSSSYAGYGCSSLAKDAEELSELLQYLDRTRSVRAFAIIGHSTGCQDAVTLLGTAPAHIRRKLRAAVLQAPVSDREAASLEENEDARRDLLHEAQSLIDQDRGSTLLSQMHYGFVPMSAARYASLLGKLTPDDMFSSDLSEEQLRVILGHMGTRGQRDGRPASPGYAAIEPVGDHPGLRTLFAHSGADEYVPSHVDVGRLSQRFVAAAGGSINGASAYIVPDANHNLATPPSAPSDFIAAVGQLLDEVD